MLASVRDLYVNSKASPATSSSPSPLSSLLSRFIASMVVVRRGQIIFIRARLNMRVLWQEVLRTKVLWGMSCLL